MPQLILFFLSFVHFNSSIHPSQIFLSLINIFIYSFCFQGQPGVRRQTCRHTQSETQAQTEGQLISKSMNKF